ncbi:MAG: GNAT family N-acetyltransferase [Candidatus Helarchaeota archaeon]
MNEKQKQIEGNRVRIRLATKENLSDLVSLWWELQSSHLRYDPYFYDMKPERLSKILVSEYFEMYLERDSHIFIIAEEAGIIIGMIHCEILTRPPIFNEEKEALLVEVVVTKKFRGQGIFQRMFEFLVTKLKLRNIKTCTLLIDVENSSGFRAYKKSGFRERQRFMICEI